MRLAAIFIPPKSLPYIFGKEHEGQTLNLGGEYEYNIVEDEQEISIIQAEKTKNFIPNFFGETITLVTALVGRNGIGKTTILRGVNHSADNKKIDALYLFEKSDNTHAIFNELADKIIKSSLEITEFDSNSLDVYKHYYSPVLDYELLFTRSAFSLADSDEETLYSNYLKTVNRSVSLLNDPVISTIKMVYPDFPTYDSTEIKVRNHRKDFFQDVYARANLGNKERADVAKIYIESDIEKIKRGEYDSQIGGKDFWISLLENHVSIINSKSFNSLFEDLWSVQKYEVKNTNRNIHDESDFLQDFEIAILSYLVLGAVFPSTPYQGSYEFSKVIMANSFEERINRLLEMYMSNVYVDIYKEIVEKHKLVDINNHEAILKIIENPVFIKFKSQGFKPENAIALMKYHLNLFKAVNEFYLYLKEIIGRGILKLDNGSLKYDFRKHEETAFNDFVSKYESLTEKFSRLPASVVLFDFKPTKVLSSGEKALLNFYATVNAYLNNIRNSKHQHLGYYLLLLDEPELGYHPYWKKKFIDAMVKIFPVLFEKINPTMGFNGKITEGEAILNPTLQIIFTTHDPLTLSDIPSHNVIYMDKMEDLEVSRIVKNKVEFKKSFAANISDLLADSFFVYDGLVGDFAKEKINETIAWLNYKKLEIEIKELGKSEVQSDNIQLKEAKSIELSILKESIKNDDPNYYLKLISIIDEPVLKTKLTEMFSEIFGEDNTHSEIELKRLADKLGYQILPKTNKK